MAKRPRKRNKAYRERRQSRRAAKAKANLKTIEKTTIIPSKQEAQLEGGLFNLGGFHAEVLKTPDPDMYRPPTHPGRPTNVLLPAHQKTPLKNITKPAAAIQETTQSKTLGEIGTSINDVLGKTKGLENLTAEKLGKGVRSISSLGLVGGLAMGAFGYGGGTLAQLGGGGLGAEVGLKAGAHYGIVGAGVGAAAGLIGGMMAGSYAHRAVSDMGNSYRFNGMKRLAY